MSLKTPQTCPKFSLFLFFLLMLQFAQAQDFSNVDELLEKNKKLLGNNVVALVWKDSSFIYQKALGTDFTGKTQAPIASCSKWLTAATIMVLVDEGKLDLDDPVVKYIPALEKYMKNYITLRQCLSHTTGIDNGKGGLAKLFERRKFENLEAEANYIATKEIANNPGTEFAYGSSGLSLAARCAEVVSKKDFTRLVQEKITRPLKMRATTFTNDNGYAPNPSGGAQSSANDYMNFLIMLLNKGMFEGKRILSEASIAEMEKNHFPGLPVKFTPKVAEGYEYGLGVWLQEKDANGQTTVVSSPGLFGTWPYIDRCRNYAAIVFVKTLLGEQQKDFYLQFKQAVDAVIGGCR